MESLPVLTWNVHRTVGQDGIADARRVESVIAHEVASRRPGVLALQEADSDDPPHRALLDRAWIERQTGLRSVHDRSDMRWGGESGGYLGNIVHIDPDLQIDFHRIVELPGHCPRAAVLVEARLGGSRVRIVSCHLSLLQALRAVQIRLIGQVIARRAPMQTILLGDLNEWRPWGGLALAPALSGMALSGPTVRTFPAGRPLLALDRVLSAPGCVGDAVALDSPAIRAASDHRPLFARVRLRGEARG
ncbi:endonuclease [Palleronia sediminis]|uniref:Endonuclease n=1 Tax=Palleronia sediminis TaxID=2547833 RepID=A0A4R6AGA8_9RHOB|nr:endonuclease/exonuclease/phosphatase family protein [Palleronia sediminis]TDL81478.1 endonuclease [Palleronia sediminis]